MKKYLSIALAIAGISAVHAQVTIDNGQGTGPTPYLQTSDSPWLSQIGSANFYLEDFEDGLLNTPGVSSSGAGVIGPGGLTDSVDGDDGSVDGSGSTGRSFLRTSGATGITFSFNQAVLGSLPQRAGIVWTDGLGLITFEAFDGSEFLLGTITGNHAGSEVNGQTAEDRFYGWEYAGGIGSIKIKNVTGGIEVDHLQYGAVPEPATMIALGLGLAGIMRKRKN